MMEREDDQALWDLLGRSPECKPSPFLARNVIRELRRKLTWQERFRAFTTPRRLVPATGLAVVVIAAAMLIRVPAPHSASDAAQDEILAKVEPEDFEVVADLDDLLAYDENSLWTESTSL